jgi:hypothetical protein
MDARKKDKIMWNAIIIISALNIAQTIFFIVLREVMK